MCLLLRPLCGQVRVPPLCPRVGGHAWGGAWEFGPEPFPSLCPRSLSQNSITDVGACKLAEALPSLASSLLRLR